MIEFTQDNVEYRDLALLQEVEANPDVSQAKLAENLGVAIGTVNWHLKRLIEKGFIKVKRARRRKLRYIITPEGISLRAKLTLAYIRDSFKLFRQVRKCVTALLWKLQEQGIDSVRLEGYGDIADVCRLTCMEQHFTLTQHPDAPALVVEGLRVRLELNEKEPIN
ncbi:MAG: winged helix-turn-helix transcriptional regulator [Chloroflexota bacterium]|jgi:DNA-binding MarR family transcriptional regulator|nr:winged helix-turn-helix transcriptional regulator [Chloroflexota bacterium]